MIDLSLRRAVRGRWGASALLCLAFVLGSRPAFAQDSGRVSGEVRNRLEVHAGVFGYDPAHDRKCGSGRGLSAGVTLQSKGSWLASVSAEALFSGLVACTDALHLFQYRGQTVRESGLVFLLGGPRVNVRVGRAFQTGSLILEPAVSAGVLRVVIDESPGNEAVWAPSYGMSLSLRNRRYPVGLRIEYGRYGAPSSFRDLDDKTVREFTVWKPLFMLSLTR